MSSNHETAKQKRRRAVGLSQASCPQFLQHPGSLGTCRVPELGGTRRIGTSSNLKWTCTSQEPDVGKYKNLPEWADCSNFMRLARKSGEAPSLTAIVGNDADCLLSHQEF